MSQQNKKYHFTLTERFLAEEEQRAFKEHLDNLELDEGIWEVFACLFRSSSKGNQPLLLRIYSGTSLEGAIVLVKCSKYGKALFQHPILSGFMNLLRIPYYQWIRFGCCMDMMSNPGFVRDPGTIDQIIRAAVYYLNKHKFLTIITDHTSNSTLYEKAAKLPALPHALVDCSEMASVQDYLKEHGNLKRKINVFRIKGGTYTCTEKILDKDQLASLKKCFVSTSKKSVFYLPYQELYLNSALTTGRTPIEGVHYFVATLNGTFIGYQAAIQTGKHLNALHGAFDRDLKSTYHAYDILFVNMTEYAIEKGLKSIDFGAVLNYTKQKMVNRRIDMTYFLLSKYSIVQKLFQMMLLFTRIQGKEQLKFRDSGH